MTRIGRHDYLTFKGNLRRTRYGWLRLTPAYSVHQVDALLRPYEEHVVVLDPFCGTGTTALVCAERGIACDTTDINPFLVWLARAKVYPYGGADIDEFTAAAGRVTHAIRSPEGRTSWVPSLHQIEKWWDSPTLDALGHAMANIKAMEGSLSRSAIDLLKVAFCRTMMDHARVSFGHQSMSFEKHSGRSSPSRFLPGFEESPVAATWEQVVLSIASAARSPIPRPANVLMLDARTLEAGLQADRYMCVVTSPPYPNRMSYIRELRPYMYWLGFLHDGREAGELDWQAIGGTWGCATSHLMKWEPPPNALVPHEGFLSILQRVAGRSEILSRYVHKYFVDMLRHLHSLLHVVKRRGRVHYIVGNSKFYDVLLPVEDLYAAMLEHVGFVDVTIQTTRKRTSKKELFEYVVSARKP